MIAIIAPIAITIPDKTFSTGISVNNKPIAITANPTIKRLLVPRTVDDVAFSAFLFILLIFLAKILVSSLFFPLTCVIVVAGRATLEVATVDTATFSTLITGAGANTLVGSSKEMSLLLLAVRLKA
jgi:hypothetical protein